MASVKTSELPALGAAPATNDRIVIVDVSGPTTATMTVANLFTGPTMTTPTLGVAAATTFNKVTITAPATGSTLTIVDAKVFTVSNTLTLAGTDGKTLTVSKSLTLDGTDATSMTFPTTSATIARTDAAQTFTGVQTMASPVIATAVTTSSSTFAVFNTTATTVNAFGAATTLNIGASATCILNFGGSTTASEFRFLEPSGGGTSYTAFKAGAQGSSITYTLPPTIASAGQVLKDVAGDGILSWESAGSGSGDVTGPVSSTDNAIVRWNGTGGDTVQDSAVTIADTTGNISTSGSISVGVGGSDAGNIALTQGAAPSAGTTNVTLYAPASVTSYVICLPGSAATGFLLGTNSSGTVTLTQVSSTGSGSVVLATSPTFATPAAFTTGGTITLAENTSIALDPAGSADGKWTGISVTGTAGYSQAFGDVNYLDPTDSRWEACDANSAAGADGDSRGLIGMVVSAGTDGTACTILLTGIIRADAKFPTFTVNNPIYISETAAAVTQTAPTTTDVVIRILGAALTSDEMFFRPDFIWTTHT